MKWSAMTYEDPQTIEVFIETSQPEKIWLVVCDYENNLRKFTERFMIVDGKERLQVMMPIAPEKILISVFNAKNGNTKKDDSFKVTAIKRGKLKQKLSLAGLQNPKIRSFVKFAQNFCFYLTDLNAKGDVIDGKTCEGLYKSDDGNFFMELLPTIIGANGQELNTPARINKETGVIQISKKAFYYLTIPEMMAILLHEFSHFNISDDIDDESEADLNGLLIYLALGYPRIEAMNAWSGVFENSNNKQNQERYMLINKFIDDFENNKI